MRRGSRWLSGKNIASVVRNSSPMKYIIIPILSLLLSGCISSGVYLIDSRATADSINELRSPSRTIPRPMSISSDGGIVYLLGRNEPGSLSIEGYHWNGDKCIDKKLPLLTEGYGSSEVALSPDAEYLAYMGIKEISNGPSPRPPEYSYWVNIYSNAGMVIKKDISTWSYGQNIWLDKDRLLMVPHIDTKPFVPNILRVSSGELVPLPNFGDGTSIRNASVSSNSRRVAFRRWEPCEISIYDIAKEQIVWRMAIKDWKSIGLEMAWGGDDVLYYAIGNEIYRYRIGDDSPEMVCQVKGRYRIDVYGVDAKGRVHFSYQDPENLNWSGGGWCVCDPQTHQWKKLFDLHYIRDVVRSSDGRYFAVSVGM